MFIDVFKAFPMIGKVAAKPTDECAPIPRAIRLRTLISRVPRQLLHLGEAFKNPPTNQNLNDKLMFVGVLWLRKNEIYRW